MRAAGARARSVIDDVFPDLPLTGVEARVFGSSVEIAFDAVDGAWDYRVYAFPDPAGVTATEDGHITVADATYRCAGNRMTVGAVQDDARLLIGF